MNRWFAVSACGEVAPGFVAHTQLLGQELALWRSASGTLNAWENRCPHRGVRLTLGHCVGEELRCQYHAWRFASGSGQCLYIPAHPNQKPASTVRPAVFSVFEDGTFAWVNLAREPLSQPLPAEGPGVALRSIFIRAPAAEVRKLLLRGYADQAVSLIDEFTLNVVAEAQRRLSFMLHPVTEDQTVLHARLSGMLAGSERLAALRTHNEWMSAVRDHAEAGAA